MANTTLFDLIETELDNLGETWERVEAIVLGRDSWDGFASDDSVLQVYFDPGYGGPNCPALAVYLPEHIISIYTYDGAIDTFTIRRHPKNGEAPKMPG